jgi:hypothetical protein
MTKKQKPADYLLEVMQDEQMDYRVRMDAAKALLPYFHTKLPFEQITTVNQQITEIVRKVVE